MKELGRLLTAMITPFDRYGNVNYQTARKLAKSLVASGSDCLGIGGTTGEAPSMTDEEKSHFTKVIKNMATGLMTRVVLMHSDWNAKMQ